MLPSPRELGLPGKFQDWRPNQAQAIEDCLGSSKRFVGQVQRTGAGKSLVNVGMAVVSKSRAMALTANKGLQDQYIFDFGPIGMKDIRGKSSYQCECLPGHTCEDGSIGKCHYKGSTMCPHTAAKHEVMEADLAVTNYSCWIAANKYGTGLGKFDMLVMDEAHSAPEQLAKAMQIQLGDHEITQMLKREWPGSRERGDMEAWKHWARVSHLICQQHVQRLKDAISKPGKPRMQMVKDYRHFRNLGRKLADIATCKPEKWIVDDWMYGYQFDPIDPSQYGERILFHGVEKIILTSGTIRPKTLTMLGIDEDDFDFFEYDLGVKPDRSPLIYIPTVKVGKNSQDWEKKRLVRRIDEIIENRTDRKGIIHTSNFKLRDFIMSNSRYARFMVSNYTSQGDITSQVIERFKSMDAPAVLVSPSVTTGYDFPYDAARYQIIAKLPFPNTWDSKVEQARLKLDPDRDAYHVMQALTQAFGRGDRAEDDWQECFVIDDNFDWFMRKYGRLAPPWLPVYIRRMNSVPEPLMEVAA